MHTTFMDAPAVDSDGVVASLSLNSTHLVYHISDTGQGRTTPIRPPVGDVHLMDTASLWGMYTYTIVTICGQTTVRLAKTIQLSFFHTLAYFSVMLQAIRTSKVSK